MLPPRRPFRNKPTANVAPKKKQRPDAKILSSQRLRDHLDQRATLVVLGRCADAANSNNG